MPKTKRKTQLDTLIEMASLINSSLDHDEIRRKAIEAIMRVLNAEAGSLLLKDQTTGELYFDVATGEKGSKLKEVRLKKGEGIAGWVAEHGQSVIVPDCSSDPRFFKKADRCSGYQTKNMICAPVFLKGNIVGVLEGTNKIDGGFGEKDRQFLNTLANHVAVALENANLYKELKETYLLTIHILAETIELRDPYTGGHTKRVHDYSLVIARHLDLPKEQMESLKFAAILHDIGKIGIRDDVLRKPGRLSPEERKAIEMHTVYGTELLKPLKLLEGSIPGMRGHHERYDGTGYPDKLQGKDIPLIARIIAIADSYDAMTSDRPYRKGLSPEQAFSELQKFSGSQFDPQLVEIFLDFFIPPRPILLTYSPPA